MDYLVELSGIIIVLFLFTGIRKFFVGRLCNFDHFNLASIMNFNSQ